MASVRTITGCYPKVGDLERDHVAKPRNEQRFGVPPIHAECVCGFVIAPAKSVTPGVRRAWVHLAAWEFGYNLTKQPWATGRSMYALDFHDDPVFRASGVKTRACPKGHGHPPECDH